MLDKHSFVPGHLGSTSLVGLSWWPRSGQTAPAFKKASLTGDVASQVSEWLAEPLASSLPNSMVGVHLGTITPDSHGFLYEGSRTFQDIPETLDEQMLGPGSEFLGPHLHLE